MAEVILMPRLSDTMTEGVVAAWHKNVGDTVKKGDLLAEIETDKATMELESYQDGILLHIGTPRGGKLQVNDLYSSNFERLERVKQEQEDPETYWKNIEENRKILSDEELAKFLAAPHASHLTKRKMPNLPLSDEYIEQLVAYIQSQRIKHGE